MQARIVWQFGSSNPDNASHFADISQWWTQLNGKEITWQQRLLPALGAVGDLDWSPQRFDESFVVASPEARGITLYYKKAGATEERNSTPQKLELDALRQQLYIFPQSQQQVVIRVGLPQVTYQQFKLNQPQYTVAATGNGITLTFRDEGQRLDVQVGLSPEQAAQLKQQL
jgi:hypothetical protein